MIHELVSSPEAQIPAEALASEVLVLVRMKAHAGKLGRVLEEIGGALTRIRGEVPECTSLIGFVDPTTDGAVLLYERWKTLGLFRTFVSSPEMVDYLGRLDPLLESRELTVWNEFGAEL